MLRSRWLAALVFLSCLSPFVYLLWRVWNQDLSANPVEYVTHFTGDWAIRLLVITLAVTPLRKALAIPDLIRFRRMLGLYSFFYGTLHLLTYLAIDHFFDFHAIAADVVRRRFITAGMAAYIALTLLAVTSTAGWIRRLGGKRWQRLHRLVYFAMTAAVVHYYWLVKSDIRLPVFYAALAALLLAYRALAWRRKVRAGRRFAESAMPARLAAGIVLSDVCGIADAALRLGVKRPTHGYQRTVIWRACQCRPLPAETGWRPPRPPRSWPPRAGERAART